MELQELVNSSCGGQELPGGSKAGLDHLVKDLVSLIAPGVSSKPTEGLRDVERLYPSVPGT